MQKAIFVLLGAVMVTGLAAGPAVALPLVLNPNFVETDVATNSAFNTGNFFISNWSPSGYGSNSTDDPGQFDNGTAGGRVAAQPG